MGYFENIKKKHEAALSGPKSNPHCIGDLLELPLELSTGSFLSGVIVGRGLEEHFEDIVTGFNLSQKGIHGEGLWGILSVDHEMSDWKARDLRLRHYFNYAHSNFRSVMDSICVYVNQWETYRDLFEKLDSGAELEKRSSLEVAA
jgi:hypothetical protein